MIQPDEDKIAAMWLDLAVERTGRTFCPFDVARRFIDDLRPLTVGIRSVAAQDDQPIDPVAAKGPIRLPRAP